MDAVMDDYRRVFYQPKPGYKTRCGGCGSIMEPGQSCQHMIIIAPRGEAETDDEQMARVNVARACRVDLEGSRAPIPSH